METFSQRLKEEAARRLSGDPNGRWALSAILKRNGEIRYRANEPPDFRVSTALPAVARFIRSSAQSFDGVSCQIVGASTQQLANRSMYEVSIGGRLERLVGSLGLDGTLCPATRLRSRSAAWAYVAGLLMACGSLSDPARSKPMVEFVFSSKGDADSFRRLLAKLAVKVEIRERLKRFVCYSKNAASISSVVAGVGGSSLVLEYEDIRLSRETVARLSRINNIDIANRQKVIAAAERDVAVARSVLALQPADLSSKLLAYCRARVANPELSLDELASVLAREGFAVSRSSLVRLARSAVAKLSPATK